MRINTPITDDIIKSLKAGDDILITGYIYTGRDAAHKRMIETLDRGEELPINIKGETIYYVGPSPTKKGQIIGSAGPTTSYRMDSYTPRLLNLGLKAMIGKGSRNKETIDSIKKNSAIYFGAIGGAAALTAKCIKSAEIIAYEDLGPEAIRKLYVEDFPVIVVIDSLGRNYYEIGQKKYLNKNISGEI